MPMQWDGDAVMARVRRHLALRLEYAGRQVRDYIREKLGEKRGPTAALTRRIRRGKAPTFGVGARASGEYPATRTGRLRRNIRIDFDEPTMTVRVGTNVRYGRYLELATRKMAARPWLSRGLRECAGAIRQALGMEIKE